ncbi:MAG: hypothetical protein GC179_18175 [Anaerolineaceae bacterium]|nr:hypothetical protein [Anaerolineaceae bacterium]
MHTQVKYTPGDYNLLIIHSDENFVRQWSYTAGLEASKAVFTTSPSDAVHILAQLRPQVIVVHDGPSSNFAQSDLISSLFESTERPILIIVSDNPTRDMFVIAHQVIPQSYLPFIDQIITSHLTRLQSAFKNQERSSELEIENSHLKQQLEYANQTSTEMKILKQAVVHNVSHELRTPMLQVKSAVALLSEDEATNRNVVELATEATIRLESGIRNVTLLNELMNENTNSESFTAVPILQIVQAALRNLGRSWEHKKDIERVELDSGSNASAVLCNRQRLTIAIQLLLDNALKFSEAKVRVKISHTKDKVKVSIQDKGIGLPQDQMSRIFEPFYQIDSSSTRRYGGMGIGLAIVRLIMEQHGTTIHIDSTKDKGSTFTFELQSSGD